MALRPRESPSSIASRCTAHALADADGGTASAAGATPKSVVTSMAGFEWARSAPSPVASAAPVVTSTSGGASPESGRVANSAPKSVVTSLAGFAETGSLVDSGGGFAAAESVITSLAGFAGGCRPQLPGGRKAIPAAFRYPAAVSRRTPVVRWIRRSDQPKRPKAMTCCFFSSFKTLLTSTEDTVLTSESTSWVVGFIVGRFSSDHEWPVLGDHRGLRMPFACWMKPRRSSTRWVATRKTTSGFEFKLTA